MAHCNAAIAIVLGMWIPSTTQAQTPLPNQIEKFVQKHCSDCHDGPDAEGGIDLYELDFDLSDEENTRRWILVHDRIASGEMPPAKKPRPDATSSQKVQRLLSDAICDAENQRSEVVLRRLNRREYENTVRDLFQTDVQITGLPEDTSTDGFDTVGEGLAVSAEAMQAYLDAADSVLDAVFGEPTKPKFIRHETNLLKQVDWKGRPTDGQFGKMFRVTDDGLVIFQSGYCPTNLVNFSRLRAPAGTYRGTMRVRAVQSDKPVTLRIYAGDTIVNRRERHLVGYYDVPPDKWTTIEFVDQLVQDGGTFQPKCYNTKDTRKDADTYPEPGIEIGDIVIEGPIDAWPPPSRAYLFGDVNPETATAKEAEEIIVRILPAAFRRPVATEEIVPYLKIFQESITAGNQFEEALRVSLKTILCSPEFLFLDEPGGDEIGAYAFASRLAYFLWSSIPDGELLKLAGTGALSDPSVIKIQIERMLGDPKAKAFTKSFTGQWLDLRDINFTEPDANLYPEFDELLRLSMISETELFFQEILDKDLSLLNFIESGFTYLNGRLASHYGIEGVVGQKFRRVKLPPDSMRGGLLTQASILKVTANGTYTSPVLRGVWVLENILGTPTSPPPDNVGSVEPDTRGSTTLREELAKHREAKSCSVCHRKIDPPGFALECFDPIGGFRERYRTMAESGERPGISRAPFTWEWVRFRIGLPVDATGRTSDGEQFTDIRDFKKLLAHDPDQIARNLTVKLLTYATGRKIGFADRIRVEVIVNNSRKQGYGFRSLIHAVALSELMRKP